MMGVSDIFDLWPSAAELARDLGLKRESHATVMRHRGRIPVGYWPRLIEAASSRQIDGLSYEILVAAHVDQPPVIHGPTCQHVSGDINHKAGADFQ